MTDNKRAFFYFRFWAGVVALAALCLPIFLAHAQTTATMYTDGTNFGIGTTGLAQKQQEQV